MDCWYFVRAYVTYLWVWLHWSRCTSSWLVLWSSWRPSSSLRPHRPPPWPFLCFFSPTNYFPLKSSKGSKCQSSRCLQNNCHNRHCRFSSWVFLYLPLRLKSATEGKKLVIPKKILLLPTSTNKSKVTFNLKNNAEQELSFYIGWHYCKLVPMENVCSTLECK